MAPEALHQERRTFAEKSSIHCPVCSCAESTLVHTGVRYWPHGCVSSCAGCGLVFLWPRPREEELTDYYTSGYREEYDATVSPEESYRRDQPDARARAHRVMPLLRRSTNVLEIGSGSGAFLEAIRPHVASVVGVEPGTTHRAWVTRTLGIETVQQLSALGQRSFELISLFHVLEHVLDPVGFLRQIARYLTPGGRLLIEVPNVHDALLTLYRVPAFPAFYFQRAHLFYFSADTLTRTLAASGATAQICGVQRYDLSNHLRWLLTGQPGGQGYYGTVFSNDTNSAYAASLIAAGLSDTLWAVASFVRT